ncbi:MAG: pyocin knob domain-containing protein [Victivallales bacterium]|nr:pyocin knob domain-containing protein [Victivallales bacterium]
MKKILLVLFLICSLSANAEIIPQPLLKPALKNPDVMPVIQLPSHKTGGLTSIVGDDYYKFSVSQGKATGYLIQDKFILATALTGINNRGFIEHWDSSKNLNNLKTNGIINAATDCQNTPNSKSGYCFATFHDSSWGVHRFVAESQNKNDQQFYIRSYYNGSWTDWKDISGVTKSYIDDNYMTTQDIEDKYKTKKMIANDYFSRNEIRANYMTTADIQADYMKTTDIVNDFMKTVDINNNYYDKDYINTKYMTGNECWTNFQYKGDYVQWTEDNNIMIDWKNGENIIIDTTNSNMIETIKDIDLTAVEKLPNWLAIENYHGNNYGKFLEGHGVRILSGYNGTANFVVYINQLQKKFSLPVTIEIKVSPQHNMMLWNDKMDNYKTNWYKINRTIKQEEHIYPAVQLDKNIYIEHVTIKASVQKPLPLIVNGKINPALLPDTGRAE